MKDSAGPPLPYASVRLEQTSRSTYADDSGGFFLRVSARERVSIEVRRIGFRPNRFQLPPGQDTNLVVFLSPSAHPLEAEVVLAESGSLALELAGFYRRAAMREKGVGTGWFLSAEDIERRMPYNTTQLFMDIPGVRLKRFPGGGWAPVGLNGCFMTIYLDHVRVSHLSKIEPAFVDGLVKPSSLAGVEIYSRATNPPMEFQAMNGHCGVILLWTK